MSAAFAPPPPINRGQNLSPVSIESGSEWSGVNNYNSGIRPDGGNSYAPIGYSSNDSMTPPDSAALTAHPPRSFGPPSIDGGGRRRPSEAGSQQSSRAVSVAHSRSSDGTLSDQQSRRYRKMEAELQQHYTILRNFLKGGAPQPPRPNKARDKLLRLSPVQFHELSTDVFDELQRRQAAAPIPGRPPRKDNVPPFLQPRSEFHEKRNQARQKLSSLQTSRFRDLSTDVFCELERRFPHFGAPDGRRRDSARSVSSRGGRGPPPRVNTANGSMSGPGAFPPRSGSIPGANGGPPFDNPPLSATSTGSDFGRPMPKQFQSSTITPNKSTMVEDDEDDEEEPDPSDAFGLESAIASPSSAAGTPAMLSINADREIKSLQDKVSDLESTLQEKDDHMGQLKQQLEKKVENAEQLNSTLQEEIELLQTEHANRERDLQSQILAAKRESENDQVWRTKHEQLQHDHAQLQGRLEEQRRITEEVSRQGEAFLREMRAMAEEGGDGSLEREEKLQSEVNRLADELQEWKAKYARAKTQLRATRATSLSSGIRSIRTAQTSTSDPFRQPDGLIKDVHLTRFQIAIDELLQAARTQEAMAVMDYVKPVVIAVRNISLDVDAAKPAAKDDEMAQRRTKLKERLAATANNVITASKNFAAAGGISPVSLLDAAASHLSAAIVDLARVVKVRTSTDTESDGEEVLPPPDGTPEPMNTAGYFNMSQPLRRGSPSNSVYSALSSPEGGDHEHDSVANEARNGVVPGGTGLGIQAGLHLKEDDTELQELKIYLENQTDLLVQTIGALVSSIRNEEASASVQDHISGIIDVIDNVLSAAEGAMDDQSWYQGLLRERAAPAVSVLSQSKDELLSVVNDPQAHTEGPSSRIFTQRLPPLAFRLARATKDLVARIESVEAGHRDGGDEDFS